MSFIHIEEKLKELLEARKIEMKVDFYSTTSMPDSLKQDFARIFQNTLSQDNLIDGKACRNFEESFSKYQKDFVKKGDLSVFLSLQSWYVVVHFY